MRSSGDANGEKEERENAVCRVTKFFKNSSQAISVGTLVVDFNSIHKEIKQDDVSDFEKQEIAK